MTEPTGNELLKISLPQTTKTITVKDLVYGLVEIYEKHVYCEGFMNRKTEKKFEQEAYKFIADVFPPIGRSS